MDLGQLCSYRLAKAFVLASALVCTLFLTSAGVAVDLNPQLVSRAIDAPVPWDHANGRSESPLLSADGSRIVFLSVATNLVPGLNTSGHLRPYRYDTVTGEVSAIGVEPDSAQSYQLRNLTADGRWMAVVSSSENLAEPGTDEFGPRAYLLNTETGEYRWLASRVRGTALISPDGRWVAIERYYFGWNATQIELIDLQTNRITNITPTANGDTTALSFSADGKTLALRSEATNLLPGIETPRFQRNPYLYELETGRLIALAPGADEDTRQVLLNEDASEVLLITEARNLVPLVDDRFAVRAVLLDRGTGEFSFLPGVGERGVFNVTMSASGQRVAITTLETLLPQDSNNAYDLYVVDRTDETLELITDRPRAWVPYASISADGSLVGFSALMPGPEDRGVVLHRYSFVQSLADGRLTKVSSVNGDPQAWSANANSFAGVFNADGSTLSFTSGAGNLTDPPGFPGSTQTYTMNTASLDISLVAPPAAPGQSAEAVTRLVFSASGDEMLYQTSQSQIRVRDIATGEDEAIDAFSDLELFGDFVTDAEARYVAIQGRGDGRLRSTFIYDRITGERTNITPQAAADTGLPVISGDGQTILFQSQAQNLVDNYPSPQYRRAEYFVWDRSTGEIELLVPGGFDVIRSPVIDYSGRFVIFSTDQCYQFDRVAKTITPVFPGEPRRCSFRSLSDDGRFLAFVDAVSPRGVLIGVPYVLDRATGEVASLLPETHQGAEFVPGTSGATVISGDGRRIMYHSLDDTITPDGNLLLDVFLVDNPLFADDTNSVELSFTAERRPDTRIIDLSASWPPEAQWTQVRELYVPGGVLWDGQALAWSGSYEVPAGVTEVAFNSRYWVAGQEFGSTDIVIELEDSTPPIDPPLEGLGSVDGFVWVDVNGDGRRDDSEPGDVGRSVSLFRCAAPWGSAGTAVSQAPLGSYEFTNVSPGMYQIGTPVEGVEFSPVANDNRVYPNGFSNCFQVDDTAPQAGIGILASNSNSVTARGFVWFDAGMDGLRNDGELAAPDRQVTAYRCQAPWGEAGRATSDASGAFEISGLTAGEYQFGIALDGQGVAPFGGDNQLFANGFTNCFAYGESEPVVGLGLLP